jgi:N-acetylglucosamine-6-phosphate deacetylase
MRHQWRGGAQSAQRGTHDARFIRPLDDQTLGQVARLRDKGVPVMVTVAPEATKPGQIAALVAMGVVVALGHSDATAAHVRAALAEGAQTFTHLFNAMSQMQNREAGVVGAAINSTAYCSIICDGIHVAPEMLALAIRARPRDNRMILVSDAMPTVAGPDSYRLYDQTIRLQDGRLVNQDGALAGAHVTMLQSVRLAHELLGQSLEECLRMAITRPAALMGFSPIADLWRQPPDDVILIAPDLTTFSRPLL